MRKAVLVVAAVAILAVIVGVGLAISYYGAKALASGLSVSNASFKSISLTPQEGGFSVVVSANLTNSAGSSMVLENPIYYVYVDDVLVGKVNGEKVTIPAHGALPVELRFTVSPSDTAARQAMAKVVRLGKANLTVKVNALIPAKAFGTLEFSAVKGSATCNNTVDVGKALQLGGFTAVKPPTSSAPPGLRPINDIEEKAGVKVVNVKWYVNGREVTSVTRGMFVHAKFTLEAVKDVSDLDLAVCLKLDIKNAPDTKYDGCGDAIVNLRKGESHTYDIIFRISGEINPNKVRGFYLELGKPNHDPKYCKLHGGVIPIMSPGRTNGTIVGSSSGSDEHNTTCMYIIYYQQPNGYPPRLKLEPDKYSVSSVTWYVEGNPVDKVVEGQGVFARVTFKAETNLYELPVEICVRADKAGLPDANVVCVTRTLNANAGKEVSETVYFTAKHYARIRGTSYR